MPDRRSKRAKEQATRLEARLALGKAEKRWREMNGLSQQNAHEWAKAEGVNYFNSQIAYFETARLDPKNEYWYSREAYNLAIASNDFPPTQKGFSRVVLDRLKQAEPFLNIDGEPATAQDFQAMFGARQEINPIYTKQQKLTKELLEEFSQQLEKTFKLVARENLLSDRDLWKELNKLKCMKAVKEKQALTIAMDVIRGEHILEADEVKAVFLRYKRCPLTMALKEFSPDPLPRKLEQIHEKLISIAT
tara:strand:- start:567 stop:1310 length:744 start_codon:yes stop_codon:yes gene_type:complete